MGRIPHRVFVAMMIFWGAFINYMYRAHFQISLLAMIKTTEKTENTTAADPDYGPRYDWGKTVEQQTIAALFYGLTLVAIPSGALSELLGPWNVLFYSTIFCGIFSSLIVPAAQYTSWIGVFVCRVIVGMFVATQYPALQCLIAKWAPPAEKGKFGSCLFGNVLGTMVTLPLAGVVVETCGWVWSFHLLNVGGIVFCILLWLLVADSPEQYRFITEEEVNFIKDAQGDTVNNIKVPPPYFKMATSVPFIALTIAQFGNQYGLFMQLTAVPQFMSKVLKFQLKKAGLLSALPQVVRLACGVTFGILTDYAQGKGVPHVYVRKGFTLFSHILSGGILFFYFLVGDNTVAAVAILVLIMAFNGAAVVTTLLNPQDLAPNWAATQYGIISFFGGWGGFIGPAVVTAVVEEQTITEWAIIFSIGGAIYVSTGIVFIIFGSTDVQPWNEKKEPEPA